MRRECGIVDKYEIAGCAGVSAERKQELRHLLCLYDRQNCQTAKKRQLLSRRSDVKKMYKNYVRMCVCGKKWTSYPQYVR